MSAAASIGRMRAWLTAQPAWVLSLVTGVSFTVMMTVLNGVQGDSWLEAAVTGAIGGAVFGLLMGPLPAPASPRAGNGARRSRHWS